MGSRYTSPQEAAALILRRAADEVAHLTAKQAAHLSKLVKAYIMTATAQRGGDTAATLRQLEAEGARLEAVLLDCNNSGRVVGGVCKSISEAAEWKRQNRAAALWLTALAKAGHLKITTKTGQTAKGNDWKQKTLQNYKATFEALALSLADFAPHITLGDISGIRKQVIALLNTPTDHDKEIIHKYVELLSGWNNSDLSHE